MQITLPNRWTPRPYQLPAWQYLRGGGKRAALCWARRHGKDDLSLHFTAIAAHERIGSYWHMLPEQAQARKAIWTAVNPHTGLKRIDEAFPLALRKRTNDQEMFIEFLNGSTWQVVGSDNYNSLVGASTCGIVFSEYALANPASWAYFRPILRENKGWAIFISTPRGKNHFYHMIELAKREPDWFGQVITNDDSHLLTQEELDADLRELQAEHGESYGKSIWMQENFCSFDAAIPGAIWADAVDRLQLAGRICEFEHNRHSPVFTGWDLGRTDDTAIWFYQFRGQEIDVIDYWAGSGCEIYDAAVPEKSITHILLDKAVKNGYTYGTHWVPHDARPRRLGMGGKSILQQFFDAAKRHPALGTFAVAPKLDVQEGIAAARKTFQVCRFHKTNCDLGLQALRHYHREWDSEKKIYLDHPVHDWCLAEGTEVLTPQGWRTVESLTVHDHVLTPLGTRRILRSGVVRWTDRWTMIRGIQCTPEHRFFTSRGLVEAENVLSRDRLWTRHDWGLKCLAFLCARFRFGFMDAIMSVTREKDAQKREASSFIEWSFRLCMETFRQVMRSIIETGTHGIIIHPILKLCRDSSIGRNINRNLAFNVSVLNAARYLDAINSLGKSVQNHASEHGTHDTNERNVRFVEQKKPAYNITVETDHCYFVKGNDGESYLVSNSSHCADAWRTVGLTWRPAKLKTPDPVDAPITPQAWIWKDLREQHFAQRRKWRDEQGLG